MSCVRNAIFTAHVVLLMLGVLSAVGKADEAAATEKGVRIDPTRYSIYVERVSGVNVNGGVLLRLQNNTKFRIRVPVACCEKPGQELREIFPLFMINKISGTVEVPNMSGDVSGEHWLNAGESADFKLLKKILQASNHNILAV